MRVVISLFFLIGVVCAAQFKLRHGPNKEMILQRDVDDINTEDEEEDGISIRKRCNCYCHSKVYHNDWDCCPCPWTQEVCFPGDAAVTLEDDTSILMKNLKPGHRVKTVDDDGHIVSSEVKPESLLFAVSVKEGDYLFSSGHCGQDLCPDMVTQVEPIVKEGVYVPLTEHGTLLVNNILASCYSSINHRIAHVFTTPFRWFPWLLSPWQENGYSPIVDWLKQFGHVILPRDLQFQEEESDSLPYVRIEL